MRGRPLSWARQTWRDPDWHVLRVRTLSWCGLRFPSLTPRRVGANPIGAPLCRACIQAHLFNEPVSAGPRGQEGDPQLWEKSSA